MPYRMTSDDALDAAVEKKLKSLQHVLADLGNAAVAFSGGTDSTLLLWLSKQALGDNLLAITAVSDTLPAADLATAQGLAREIRVEHVLLPTDEVDDADYRANTPDRCYHCRRIVYGALIAYVRQRGFGWLIDGANADDLYDYRPGARAAREHGVRSPFQEAGLSKAEIRQLAHHFGLPNWDKPAASCLATRIPYGTPITRERLSQVRRAEEALKCLGIAPLRVRYHDAVARIEVSPRQLHTVVSARASIVRAVKEVGFAYVTVDLEGFRSGSMNEVIEKDGHGTSSPSANTA